MFPQKISSVILNAKISSPRTARSFFKKHSVKLNGIEVENPDVLCDTDIDEIKVDGTDLEFPEHLYFLFNKPKGIVCSTVSDRHGVIYDFFPDELLHPLGLSPLHSAGRLDSETSGLIFLTTNGAFSHRISSPENHIPKKYLVSLEKRVEDFEKEKYFSAAKNGILLPAEKKFPEQFLPHFSIEFLSESECIVTVTQGLFHEVRRIFLALENKVVSLKRIAIGNVVLDEMLDEGKWRKLSEKELKGFE